MSQSVTGVSSNWPRISGPPWSRTCWQVTAASYLTDAVSIKTLVMPEWWLLVPLPIAFLVFAIEFLFRMHRLATSERAPRTEAVSAS